MTRNTFMWLLHMLDQLRCTHLNTEDRPTHNRNVLERRCLECGELVHLVPAGDDS